MTNVLGAKDPDVDAEYAIDPRASTIVAIRRAWPYQEGAIGKAPVHTGFYYENAVAGETQDEPPYFPILAGARFRDGSTEWITRHPDDAALPTIVSVDWDGGGLTVISQSESQRIVYVKLGGGTVEVRYSVRARITWSNGQVDDVTVIVPCRSL